MDEYDDFRFGDGQNNYEDEENLEDMSDDDQYMDDDDDQDGEVVEAAGGNEDPEDLTNYKGIYFNDEAG